MTAIKKAGSLRLFGLLALSGLILFNPTTAGAQLPGITQPMPAAAPPNNQILTGKIKSDIIPPNS